MQVPPSRRTSGIDPSSQPHRPATGGNAPISSDAPADRVTLSPAAKEPATRAAELESAPLSVNYGAFSAGVHASGRQAEDTTKALAYAIDQPLLDATDFLAGKGPLRYAATGEPVSPESESRFNEEAHRLRDERITIYERGMANGTSAADIMDELIAHMAKQPSELCNTQDGRTSSQPR